MVYRTFAYNVYFNVISRFGFDGRIMVLIAPVTGRCLLSTIHIAECPLRKHAYANTLQFFTSVKMKIFR